MWRFIIKILKRLNLFEKFNFKFIREVNKQKFYIPIIQGNGEGNLYSSEEWKIYLLDKLTKLKQGLFIDIGVNIGQTLIKLKSVDANYPYVGFEPNVNCAFYLKTLIKYNKWKNTSIIPIGIGNANEVLELNFHFGGDEESASMIKNLRPNDPIVEKEFVSVFSFDVIKFLFVKKVSIIKIDVEGYELEVLKGMSNFLKEQSPFIICEILPVYSKENQERLVRQNELLNLLFLNDYCIFRILPNGSLEELTEIGIHADIDLTYYLFVKRGDYYNIKNTFVVKPIVD